MTPQSLILEAKALVAKFERTPRKDDPDKMMIIRTKPLTEKEVDRLWYHGRLEEAKRMRAEKARATQPKEEAPSA